MGAEQRVEQAEDQAGTQFFPAVDTVEKVFQVDQSATEQGAAEVVVIRPASLVRTGFDLTHEVAVYQIAS